MSKLFNTLLLFTVLTCCNSGYTSDTMEYSPLYDRDGIFLKNCKIEGETGQLYYCKKGTEDKKYLVDESNKPYYDLQTILNNKITSEMSADITLQDPTDDGEGWNLVVMSNYAIPSLKFNIEVPGNTNLIIPKGVELTNSPEVDVTSPDAYNGKKIGGLVFKDCSNSSILIFGKLLASGIEMGNSPITIKDFDPGLSDLKIILAPEAEYLHENPITASTNTTDKLEKPGTGDPTADTQTWNHNQLADVGFVTNKYPSPVTTTSTTSNPKFLLYPGCKGNADVENSYNVSETIELKGTIYLNRFNKTPAISGDVEPDDGESQDNALVKMTTSSDVHMILPINSCKENYKLKKYNGTVKNGNTYYATEYLPGCYWNVGGDKGEEYLAQGSGHGEYSFEGVEQPLAFNLDEDGTKLVLGLNKNSEFAKYDAKLWKECTLNNEEYGFKSHNRIENKGNYFNTDDAYKLFYDVNYSKRMPLFVTGDSIFLGLLGSRDIELKTESTQITIYGDNTNYEGSLILPNQVNSIRYFNKSSKIPNILRLDKNGEKIDMTFNPSQLTISYPANNNDENSENSTVSNQIVWDLAKKGKKLRFEPKDKNIKNPVLVTVTNSSTNKYNKIIVDGDNTNMNGIIVTPPEIKDVIFEQWSFMKTMNVSGKELNYIFKGKNFFRPFKAYNKVLADKPYYINEKYLTDKPNKDKEQESNQQYHHNKHDEQYYHWKDHEDHQRHGDDSENKPTQDLTVNTVKFDLQEKGNTLDLGEIGKFDRNKVLILTDSTSESPYNKLLVKGDNKLFKGMIITTPEIEEVEFDSRNSFVNVVNPNGNELKYIFADEHDIVPSDELDNGDDSKSIITVHSHTYENLNKRKHNGTKIFIGKLNVERNAVCMLGVGTPFVIGPKTLKPKH